MPRPGPVLDPDDPLVDQHAEAIDRLAAARFGVADEAALWRVGDDVGDHHLRAERGEIEVDSRLDIGIEADRRRIDDDVGGCRYLERALPGHFRRPRRAERELRLGRRLLVEERDECLATVMTTVDDRDLAGTGKRELDPDRPGRAAGAEHHHLLAARIDHFHQRLQEALAVGVLADQGVATADGAVHRPHDPRRFTQAVEVLDDRDLVRERAVEPGPAHGTGAAHRVAKLLRRHLAIDVAGVHAVMAIGGLDHGDGRVVGSPLREGAGELAQEIQRLRHSSHPPKKPRFWPLWPPQQVYRACRPFRLRFAKSATNFAMLPRPVR
jgi:hypothetical protein